jgi:hypothetical protein
LFPTLRTPFFNLNLAQKKKFILILISMSTFCLGPNGPLTSKTVLVAIIICSATFYLLCNSANMKKLSKGKRLMHVGWFRKCSCFACSFSSCKHQKIAILVLLSLFVFVIWYKRDALPKHFWRWSNIPGYCKLKKYWRLHQRMKQNAQVKCKWMFKWNDGKQVEWAFHHQCLFDGCLFVKMTSKACNHASYLWYKNCTWWTYLARQTSCVHGTHLQWQTSKNTIIKRMPKTIYMNIEKWWYMCNR